MARVPVPRTRCSGEWTEGKYNSFIRGTLRRASLRWPPIYKTFQEARVDRGIYICNKCKNNVPLTIKNPSNKSVKNIQVNHKVPVSLPGSWDGWDGFIERLYCEQEGLEALCSDCHDKYTLFCNKLEEEWKVIEGFENYEVSSYGRIRHIENGLRSLVKDAHYLRCRMWDSQNGKYILHNVHRLVATTFIPNPENLPEVNHKDGYKFNNFSFNLEWATRKGNAEHASKQGLYLSGDKHPNFKGYWVTPEGKFTSVKEAAINNNISPSHCYKLCKKGQLGFDFEPIKEE